MRCLKDAGRARCWAQLILCSAGLGSGLAFGEIVAPLVLIHGADFDFRICKVVNLRDHQIKVSKIKVKVKHRCIVCYFFNQGRAIIIKTNKSLGSRELKEHD